MLTRARSRSTVHRVHDKAPEVWVVTSTSTGNSARKAPSSARCSTGSGARTAAMRRSPAGVATTQHVRTCRDAVRGRQPCRVIDVLRPSNQCWQSTAVERSAQRWHCQSRSVSHTYPDLLFPPHDRAAIQRRRRSTESTQSALRPSGLTFSASLQASATMLAYRGSAE